MPPKGRTKRAEDGKCASAAAAMAAKLSPRKIRSIGECVRQLAGLHVFGHNGLRKVAGVGVDALLGNDHFGPNLGAATAKPTRRPGEMILEKLPK